MYDEAWTPTQIQARQASLVISRQESGCRWYVLWINESGGKHFSGPYRLEEDANNSTAVRDMHSISWVIRREVK